MGRISSGSSRDLLSDIAISDERWDALDQIGRCQTSRDARANIKAAVLSYENERHRQKTAPTYIVVAQPLMKLEAAAAKFKHALDEMLSPQPHVNDETASKAILLAEESAYRMVQRIFDEEKIYPEIPADRTMRAQLNRLRLVVHCWQAGAGLAVKELRREFGKPSATADIVMRTLLDRIAPLYVQAGGRKPNAGRSGTTGRFTPFVLWVHGLLELQGGSIRTATIATAIRRWSNAKESPTGSATGGARSA